MVGAAHCVEIVSVCQILFDLFFEIIRIILRIITAFIASHYVLLFSNRAKCVNEGILGNFAPPSSVMSDLALSSLMLHLCILCTYTLLNKHFVWIQSLKLLSLSVSVLPAQNMSIKKETHCFY